MKIFHTTLNQTFLGQAIQLHPCIIQHQSETWLVDTGYEGSLPLLQKELSMHGLALHDLTGIIISHDDIDHIGGLFEIRQALPHIPVFAPAIEIPYIAGYKQSLRLTQAEAFLPALPENQKDWGIAFLQSLRDIKRVHAIQPLEPESNFLPGLQIMPTPGHTPGHISLYFPEAKVLIANDALVFEKDALDIANPGFTLDLEAAIRSVHKLAALEIETLYCYHGGMVSNHLNEKFAALLNLYPMPSHD